MGAILFLATSLAFFAPGHSQSPIGLRTGQKLAASAAVQPGRYLAPVQGNDAAVEVTADDVTIDFQGSSLNGEGDFSIGLEGFHGVGLLIKGRKNVTIRHAKIHGYQFNIQVIDSENVKLADCEVGASRSERIMRNGAPVAGFLNLRDVAEWRNYGAGIWMEKCRSCTVARCRANESQNGLLLIDCGKCVAGDNDFSFLSGWGIGLYRSDDNAVSWNRCDFVNRPWGGGWGGDSAAIAVANGCHRNLFVGNSMTHSGDGFFLSDQFNGRDDETTHEFVGSSDDNVVALSDGSWSTANAFEGTFSFRNSYIQNRADHSSYGFWLGYSSKSLVLDNQVIDSLHDGVAIEHGAENRILRNNFEGNRESAIHLWAGNGNAPEARRHPSARSTVWLNTIKKSQMAVSLENSAFTLFGRNVIEDAQLPPGIAQSDNDGATEISIGPDAIPALNKIDAAKKERPKTFKFYRETGLPTGVEWIQSGDYAPRDFRFEKAAWRQISDHSLELFAVTLKDVTFRYPDWLEVLPVANTGGRRYIATAKPPTNGIGRFRTAEIEVMDRGDAGASQKILAPLASTVWHLRWFTWDKSLAWDNALGWGKVFAQTPVIEEDKREITGDFSFRPPAQGVPTEYYAFEATTKLDMEAGKYSISTLSDDGIRVFVDGKEVISAWRFTPGDLSASFELDKGVHRLRVLYSQSWGNAYLTMRIAKLG